MDETYLVGFPLLIWLKDLEQDTESEDLDQPSSPTLEYSHRTTRGQEKYIRGTSKAAKPVPYTESPMADESQLPELGPDANVVQVLIHYQAKLEHVHQSYEGKLSTQSNKHEEELKRERREHRDDVVSTSHLAGA